MIRWAILFVCALPFDCLYRNRKVPCSEGNWKFVPLALSGGLTTQLVNHVILLFNFLWKALNLGQSDIISARKQVHLTATCSMRRSRLVTADNRAMR